MTASDWTSGLGVARSGVTQLVRWVEDAGPLRREVNADDASSGEIATNTCSTCTSRRNSLVRGGYVGAGRVAGPARPEERLTDDGCDDQAAEHA